MFLKVANEQFELHVYENMAFFEDSLYNDRVINAIENGQDLVSRTIYSDKTYSIETFDVSRFVKIKSNLIKHCPDVED